MRIVDVDVTVFEWTGIPQATFGERDPTEGSRSELGLLTVRTDDGLEGHAFLGTNLRSVHMDVQSLLKHLKPVVIGQSPLERGRLSTDLMKRYRSSTFRAIGALDIALWDLAGKATGMPIHALIGTCHRKVAAYASSPALGDAGAYADQAQSMVEEGFRAYKLIAPYADLTFFVACCRRVRDAVGPDVTLMADAVGAFGYEAALRVGRSLEEMDFRWFEDPLPEDDIHNYAKLRQKLSIPLLATEMVSGGSSAYVPWLVAGATDYLRADVAINGGITPVLKTARLAEAFHTTLELHHGGNSLCNYANLHVAAAIPNTGGFEFLLPRLTQQHAVDHDLWIDDEGYVSVPEAPGLGAEIDFSLIQRNTVTVLR